MGRLFPAREGMDKLMQPGAEGILPLFEILGDLVDHVYPETIHAPKSLYGLSRPLRDS